MAVGTQTQLLQYNSLLTAMITVLNRIDIFQNIANDFSKSLTSND